MFKALRHTLARMSISEIYSEWLVYIRRFTPRTQQHYRMVIRNFLDFAGHRKISELTTKDIQAYISQLLWTRKNATANRHLTAIKSWFSWLNLTYGLPNPARLVRIMPEEPPDQKIITHKQYLEILKHCTTGQAEVIQFLANTGLRATEACRLTWDCIDEQLTKVVVHGKGRKLRVVPLNKTCRRILARYSRKAHTITFLKSDRHRLYKLCRKAGHQAQIHLNSQMLRHYFATELMRRGVPLAKISKLLGHSSVRTTERIYIHWLPDDLLGVTDVLD